MTHEPTVATTFQINLAEPLIDSINTNLRPTHKLLEMAKRMGRLEAFLHISSAYANCDREVSEEQIYSLDVSIFTTPNCLLWLQERGILLPGNSLNQARGWGLLKGDHGLELSLLRFQLDPREFLESDKRILDGTIRPCDFGFPNGYTFSKRLTELLLNEYAKHIPVVIIRPSIICGKPAHVAFCERKERRFVIICI